MSQARMVNMAFMAAALLLWVVSAQLFAGLFDLVGPTWNVDLIGKEFFLSDLMGIAVGVVGGIALWRHAELYRLAHEVALEVEMITWPSVEETRVSTLVVIATTILIATALWAFDIVFLHMTRLLYGI